MVVSCLPSVGGNGLCDLSRPHTLGCREAIWTKRASIFSEETINYLEGEINETRDCCFGRFGDCGLAAGNVWATSTWAFEPDNYFNNASVYPQIPNDSTSGYYSTLPYGPTATADGFIWLKTSSSGSPALFSGSTLTVACYYLNTSGSYTFEETENANGSAYPGQWVAGSPLTLASDVTAGGVGRYVADNNLEITGTEKIVTTDLEDTLVTWSQTKFYLQMWTGSYSSYAAANAASAGGRVSTCEMAPFYVDLGGGGEPPFDYVNEFTYMPAVVLDKGVAIPSLRQSRWRLPGCWD